MRTVDIFGTNAFPYVSDEDAKTCQHGRMAVTCQGLLTLVDRLPSDERVPLHPELSDAEKIALRDSIRMQTGSESFELPTHGRAYGSAVYVSIGPLGSWQISRDGLRARLVEEIAGISGTGSPAQVAIRSRRHSTFFVCFGDGLVIEGTAEGHPQHRLVVS